MSATFRTGVLPSPFEAAPFRSRAEICYNTPMTPRVVFSMLAGGVLGVIVAWLAGLLWFASTIPATVEDTRTHTDAIVVLTGGSERIETGFKLLSDGLADRLFVSGVGGQLRAGDLVARTRALPPELADKVSVGGEAADTPGNAIETAAWARTQHVGSIRLVTAGYHMPRSLLEFHAAMPGVQIVPHAVFPANVKTDWWRWPGTASLIAREYTKFVLAWTRQNLGLGQRAFAGAPRTQPVAVPV